jgi:hypothetical protein
MAKSGLASDLGVFTWNVSDQSGSSRVSEISDRGLRLGRVRNRTDSRCLRCWPSPIGRASENLLRSGLGRSEDEIQDMAVCSTLRSQSTRAKGFIDGYPQS